MTAPTPALVVMAKEPVAGSVKTRLGAMLSADQSLDLYRAFLLDKVDQVVGVAGVTPYLAYTPPGARPAFEQLVGGRIALLEQRGGDLGERLRHVADDLGSRHAGVLLVDSDTPNLPSGALVEAVDALGASDVVIGPAWDGGYYLLGMRRPDPELFGGIAWSTGRVLAQTIENVRRRGSTLHFLPSWYDVDRPPDLQRLARDLAAAPPALAGYPRRTAEVVRRLVPAPAEPLRNEQWQTVASRRVYQNPWTRVDESIVRLPDGHVTLYGVVTCPECVGIVPFFPDGCVALVRQFRYVARRETWEIPTGGVADGESLTEAAQRELSEECGYRAGRLVHLSSFHTSKSVMDETAHIYAGLDLEPSSADRDETESIEVRRFPFEDTLDMVSRGEIVDSMSVVGLLLAARASLNDSEPTS